MTALQSTERRFTLQRISIYTVKVTRSIGGVERIEAVFDVCVDWVSRRVTMRNITLTCMRVLPSIWY